MSVPKSGTISPEMGMIELMPADNIKCLGHDCPSKEYCWHYVREMEEHMTWIMPMNTGIDCYDFEPTEDE